MIIANWDETDFSAHVFVSGCFDILHAGHLKLLNYAATFGPVVVGVNSDNAVFDYKGKWPTIRIRDRLEIINSLSVVDKCFFFDYKDAREVVRIIKPKLWILGDDHAKSKFENLSCPVKFFPRDENSSTQIKRLISIGSCHAQK